MALFAGAFKKYAVFTGRARRAEFWYFVLFNFIITTAASIALGNGNPGAASNIGIVIFLLYIYAACMPSIALFVRRIHDTGNSGWFALVPVYNIILLFIPGTNGPNRFGPDSKQTEPEAPVKLSPGMMVLRILSILAPVWYIGCLVVFAVIGDNWSSDLSGAMFVICGLLVLFFAAAHAIIAFLQGIKYKSAPVKISALVDLALLGLSVVCMVLVLIFSKVARLPLWLGNLLSSGLGIGIIILLSATLLYLVILAVATMIWSFREKKTE
jgi:uncharacterized membrane protein YhaH (DUF805 family)